MGLLNSYAQVKPKQYQPTPQDWQKQVPFLVIVTAGQFANYGVVLQNGGPQGIANSDKFKGNEITAYTKDYFIVMDSVNASGARVVTAWYKANEAKWAADTLKASKVKPFVKQP